MLTRHSMPGFLEVYGYYNTEAGSWAIDVSLRLLNLIHVC